MTLHFIGGFGGGTVEGKDFGKNSPGHRCIKSIKIRPIKIPCIKGPTILNNLPRDGVF